MLFADPKKLQVPTPEKALPGRTEKMSVAKTHAVLGSAMEPPWPAGSQVAMFALGCFWGAEKLFWKAKGVISTQVGYAAGSTPNPTYEETCTGLTGHTEVVRIVFDPTVISFDALLTLFWENHDPTQGMRQGGDVGTQYRSGIYAFDDAQKRAAEASKVAYQRALGKANHGAITTELIAAPEFYYAEDYHQQYLHKNPDGYCGLGGTGVTCPIGLKT